MVHADLHVHTTNSDGRLTVDAIPAAAAEAGVEVVAVTDHDRLHPALSKPVTHRDGVDVVHGIELRVETATGRVDLLGYGVRRTDALVAELDRIQRDRKRRGRRIVERVEARLGIDLDVEIREGIGRPHVARAIDEHPGTDYDYEGAFADLIGDDGPCYVPRDVPDAATGRSLLAEACSVVALAHPLRYDDPESALEFATELDAIERYYPYDREVDLGPVDRAIEAGDLLATGGSDAHDRTLGLAGLDREDYGRVADRLPGG